MATSDHASSSLRDTAPSGAADGDAQTLSGGAGRGVSLREAFWVWLRVAINSFGGPAGQIAVMHRIIVEEKRWIGEQRFLHALNYCMLLPGPEAQQLATYIGWLMHRTRGGLMAGLLFILPGFLAILVLSLLYAQYGDLSLVQGLFFGIKAAVLAVVAQAVLRIGRRALRNRVMVTLAAAAFIGIFVFAVPFPLIVLAAGLLGWAGGLARWDAFQVITGHDTGDGAEAAPAAGAPRPPLAHLWRVGATWLPIWFGPLILLALLPESYAIFLEIGVFFSKAAVVTFGGAYAVLAYLAQAAVETYGWLEPGEMVDGLGLAETTPGPLIMVVQFVGFRGAFRAPGPFDPVTAAVLASVLTTWVTFAPCFLWIFLGAPYIEALRGNRYLSAALSAITAAVVGVILNLAVWFALHTIFAQVRALESWGARLYVPDLTSLQWAPALLTAAALVAVFRFRRGMLTTVGGCGAAGIILRLVLG